MSVSAAIRRMLDAGLTIDQALIAAEAFEAEQEPTLTTRQARNRRYYQNQKNLPYKRGDLTSDMKEEILERDEWACTYCGSTGAPLHVDHIHPISRGGSNHPDNLCAACIDCNVSKGAKTLEEWGYKP